MKYDPAIHSPIFGPDEKPEHAGWYVSSGREIDTRSFNMSDDLNWWQFDGHEWFADDGNVAAFVQDRYWFGLREKPEVLDQGE